MSELFWMGDFDEEFGSSDNDEQTEGASLHEVLKERGVDLLEILQDDLSYSFGQLIGAMDALSMPPGTLTSIAEYYRWTAPGLHDPYVLEGVAADELARVIILRAHDIQDYLAATGRTIVKLNGAVVVNGWIAGAIHTYRLFLEMHHGQN